MHRHSHCCCFPQKVIVVFPNTPINPLNGSSWPRHQATHLELHIVFPWLVFVTKRMLTSWVKRTRSVYRVPMLSKSDPSSLEKATVEEKTSINFTSRESEEGRKSVRPLLSKWLCIVPDLKLSLVFEKRRILWSLQVSSFLFLSAQIRVLFTCE